MLQKPRVAPAEAARRMDAEERWEVPEGPKREDDVRVRSETNERSRQKQCYVPVVADEAVDVCPRTVAEQPAQGFVAPTASVTANAGGEPSCVLRVSRDCAGAYADSDM
jgi:hypothetical protein